VDVDADAVVVSKVLRAADERELGAVVLRFSLARENARVSQARWSIAGLIGLLTLAVSATMVWVSRRVVIAPLRVLTDAARRVELGSPEPVSIEANDEIGQLARGFNAMAGAIVDREKSLASLNHGLEQLVDNMRQAIVVFTAQGLLEPVKSRRTRELFGRTEFDRARVQDLLYPDAGDGIVAAAFDQWVQVAFDVTVDGWGDIASLAPTTVILGVGTERERVFALDFRPIDDNGRIERIMMLVSDETQVTHLERAVKEQEKEHEHQMSAMRRLMAGGGQLLVSVLNRARSHLVECDELIDRAEGVVESSLVEALFQHAHSVKGEARAFDLAALDASASELEDFLAILRGRLREKQALTMKDIRDDLARRVVTTRDSVSRAAEMLVQASPIGAAILDQIAVQRSDVEHLFELAGDRDDAVGRVAGRIASRPFGEALLGLLDAVPRWAMREGKRVAVAVEGRDVLVPPALARVLPDVLMHLLRNAIAHGIESVSDRVAAGKADVGVVRVSCRLGARGPEIAVEDDGAGLDPNAIRAQARNHGLRGDGDVADLVFAQGLSTAGDTSLAGHGVGLGAVRSDLARVGYKASLVSLPTGLRVTIEPSLPATTVQAPVDRIGL
jgi:two-component system chemotaxis sensor kinase CheA